MKVIQMLPSLNYGDATGNDVLALRDLIQEMGYETQIYAKRIDDRLPEGTAILFEHLLELSDDDVIICHTGGGSSLNARLPELNGQKIMIYHNITPPEFFRPYSDFRTEILEKGYRLVQNLSDKLDYCIADSEFNKGELLRMGFTCPIDVCPILIPFSDYETPPNEQVLRKYRGDGCTNLLFVGRIAPNKRQENVIRAFHYYHTNYNPRSRLFLVGSSERNLEKYNELLSQYVQELDLSDSVIFTGHTRFDEMLAYYRLADVFVCMSEHEGFCVPLVEAMYFDVPIVAYNSSAVPYTLGGSGILLESNAPEFAAGKIHEIVTDHALREELLYRQKQRLDDFTYENVSKRFRTLLANFIRTKGSIYNHER